MPIEPITILQIALFALKTARDTIPALLAHKDRCTELIERCERLVAEVCTHFKDGSPAPLERHLKVVESACLAVRDTTMILSDRHAFWRLFHKGKIDDEFKKASTELDDAFTIFNVGAHITATRLLEELREKLRENRQQVLAYLESLSNDRQQTLREIQSRPPLSPVHDLFPITPVERPSWRIAAQEIELVEDTRPMSEGTNGQVRRGRIAGKLVAVKQIHQGVARMLFCSRQSEKVFERKARQWAQLSHPHVSQFLGACLKTEQPFLVTYYCPNGNAMEYIQKFPECNILSILHQVSCGMLYLHDQEIIHANLKPASANILVNDGHQAMVHDYEISRLKDEAPLSGSVSRHNIYGTWNYMAPEYLDGDRDYAADVYSFAMSVWELHTGCVPFHRVEWRKFRHHIKTSRPPKPSSINDFLWASMQQWWCHDPSSRTSFKEIEPFLRKFIEPSPGQLSGRSQKGSNAKLTTLSIGESPKSSGSRVQTPTSPFSSISPTSPQPSSSNNSARFVAPLSSEGQAAIIQVRYALYQSFNFDNLAKDILLCYGNWLKVNLFEHLHYTINSSPILAHTARTSRCLRFRKQLSNTSPQYNNTNARGPRPQHIYKDDAAKAVSALKASVEQWVSLIPSFRGADIFDIRRAILFIAVICIMAEGAFRQKMRMPHCQMDIFINENLARSDFRAFLEGSTQIICSAHEPSPMNLEAICKDTKRMIEQGCEMLTPRDY